MGKLGQVFNERFNGRRYRSRWTAVSDSELVVKAKNYKTRNAWRCSDPPSYQEVHKHRRHLLEACTAHMERQGDPFGAGYQVYAYEFADQVAYIGLTCNLKRRHKDHRRKGRVANKIRAGIKYELKVVASGLMPTVAAKLEHETIIKYKTTGWTVLNRRCAGSTGSIRTKYTYAKLLELARPFRARKQFNVAHNGAYQYACNHRLINKIATELGWPEHAGHKWTKALCILEANKHKWLSDWAAAPGGSYVAAQKQGWLTEIRALFKLKPNGAAANARWTKGACAKRAKDFKSRVDWQYGCRDGSYVAARRKGWLGRIAQRLYGKRLNRWSQQCS